MQEKTSLGAFFRLEQLKLPQTGAAQTTKKATSFNECCFCALVLQIIELL
jgi:hypothetical protein